MKNMSLLVMAICAIKTGIAQSSNRVIDSLISSTIRTTGIPALAAAYITTDTFFLGVGGTTKTGGQDKVDLFSEFHIGSNTKAITSLMAMKMVEQGKIRLSSKLIETVPALKTGTRKEYAGITLADLLSHRARVQPYTSGSEYEKLPVMNGSVTDKRMAFARFVLIEDTVTSGTYSNAGYAIASLMLETAAGKPFEKLLEETMKELRLGYSIGFPSRKNIDYPWGHWEENGKFVALGPDHSYKLRDYVLAAGDVSMNIIDYSKFVQMHLRGLNGQNNYLTGKDYEAMHFSLPGYSYGWGNSELNGIRLSHHDGSAGTFYCHTILIPARKMAVVIFSSSAREKDVEAIYALREQLLINRNKY